MNNFGAGGWIEEVITELLTPVLKNGIFVIYHMSKII
jgi:hypothetical protein